MWSIGRIKVSERECHLIGRAIIWYSQGKVFSKMYVSSLPTDPDSWADPRRQKCWLAVFWASWESVQGGYVKIYKWEDRSFPLQPTIQASLCCYLSFLLQFCEKRQFWQSVRRASLIWGGLANLGWWKWGVGEKKRERRKEEREESRRGKDYY